MIRNKDILNSLPLLASVLGRNYGVTVQIGGDSAYTNGNEIHIPSLPLNCDKEMVWLARGYIDHESAHIRFTDFEALQRANLDPVTHNLWNAIEDWRVEERLSQIYPGCRRHFHWLASKIFVEERDKTQEEAGANPTSSILDYVLLAVRSWSVPEIAEPLKRIMKQVDSHFQGLRLQIDEVLSRIQKSCQSTNEAIDYAREIAKLIREWKPENPPSQFSYADEELMDTPAPSKEENIDSQDSRQSNAKSIPNNEVSSDDTQTPDATSNTQTSCKSECDAKSEQNKRGLTEQNPKQSIADLFACMEDDLPKSFGDQIASTLQGAQATKQDSSICVATEGAIGHCTVPQKEKENALRASVALRSRLQGLLQARMRQAVRIGQRGSLSTKHLYRLRIGNSRIFTTQEDRQGLNTAVHLLVDVSSSMSGAGIQLARQSCYAVAKALSNIRGINPAVTAFPSADCTENTVAPLLKHGEKLPPYLSVKANGSTPLAEALWWVMQTMLSLRESRKIILILTDGMPNSVPNAKSALDNAKKAGFEVFGIGILSSSIAQLLPKTSQAIYNLTDLAPTMFTILQKALLKGENV